MNQETQINPNRRINLLIKWVISCLVFYLLPFLTLYYGLDVYWSSVERASLKRHQSVLDNLLFNIKAKENPLTYIYNEIIKIGYQASQLDVKNVKNYLVRRIKKLEKRFSGIIRFTVCDAEGNIIKEVTNTDFPKFIVKKFYNIATNSKSKEEMVEKFNKDIKYYRQFIGSEVTHSFLNLYSRGFGRVSIKEKDRYFGYFLVAGKFGIMAHLTETSDFMLSSLRDFVGKVRKLLEKKNINLGVFDIRNDISNVNDELLKALSIYQQTNQRSILLESNLFSIETVHKIGRLWLSIPRSKIKNYNSLRIFTVFFGLVLVCLLSLYSYHVMVCGVKFVFPIRLRLMLLFLFAAGLPLLVVLLTGYDYLDQKTDITIRQAFEDLEKILYAFDSRFSLMCSKLEEMLVRRIKMFNFSTEKDQQIVKAYFTKFEKKYEPTEIIIFKPNGNVAWDTKKDLSDKGSRGRKILGTIAVEILAYLNGEESNQATDIAISFIESMTGVKSPGSEIAKNLGRIFEFGLGKEISWSFVYPIQDNHGKYSHLVVINWRKKNLEKLHVLRESITMPKYYPGLRIFGVENDENQAFIPRHVKYKNYFTSLIKELSIKQTSVYKQISLPNGKFLSVGIKPKELATCSIVGILPLEPILKNIYLLRNILITFVIVVFSLAVYLGFVLSERFLNPISDLTTAVNAIEKRNFKLRIPFHEEDELGLLAKTFNRVMEGLSDLEVARIVQESLVPSQEVKNNLFKVYGTISFASELGGDYFDLIKLPDERILVIVGDVSGHGVPAALVMAMAKVIVEREIELKNYQPDTILKAMHDVFFNTLKRKKMMTCFICLLDAVNQSISFSNAGHNFPIHFSTNSKPEFLEANAFPLGSIKKNNFMLITKSLQNNDFILLYTDGLVEARMKNGDNVGYERILDEIPKFLISNNDLKDVCNQIFAWHRQLTQSPIQDDDITVVIISCYRNV